SFTYTIRDQAGNLSNAATVSITITPATGTVTANDDTATIAKGATAPVTGNVLTNDTNTGSGPLVVSAVAGNTANLATNLPGMFGTFHINANGDFTYTLDNTNTNVVGLTSGAQLIDTVVYTAS